MFKFLSRQCSRAGLAAALVFATMSVTADTGDSSTYMTLNGIRSLVVELDGMQRDFARFGLTEELILARTTSALRDNGIEVVESSAMRSNPGTALLRIKISANENQYRFYFYGISLELKQKIPLNNPAGGYITGTIWQEGQTGIVMPTELRKINDVIAALLAEFVKDYRSQNPRQLSSTN